MIEMQGGKKKTTERLIKKKHTHLDYGVTRDRH